jgi:hypothetical protein
MKTPFTTLLMAFAMATGAFAQQPDAPSRADLNSDRLIKELGLEGNQAEQVRALNNKYAQELAQLKQGQDQTTEQFREQRKDLFVRRDAELKKALTTAQWDQLQQLRAQWKAEQERKKEVNKQHAE